MEARKYSEDADIDVFGKCWQQNHNHAPSMKPKEGKKYSYLCVWIKTVTQNIATSVFESKQSQKI